MSMFLRCCALSLVLALPASAQQPRPEGPPGRPDIASMRAREAGDIALLLGLSAAQRPLLDAFLASGPPPHGRFGPPPLDPRAPRMTPPETPPTFEQHLAKMEEALASRTAEERRRIALARSFYASLDARQRGLFEALERLRHAPPGPGPFAGPGGPMPFGGPGAPPFDGGPQGEGRPGPG